MAQPATKANQFIDILNVCMVEGKRVGDLDRFAMQKYIQDEMPTDPALAIMMRGMLAHADGKFEDAKGDLEKAVEINPASMIMRCNLVTLLSEAGYAEAATEQLKIMLQLSSEQNRWDALNMMTEIAVALGNMDIVAEIVKIANKLDLCTPVISQAALLLFVEGESEQETLKNFDNALTEEKLRPLCGKISDERWAELKKLAAELEPLVN